MLTNEVPERPASEGPASLHRNRRRRRLLAAILAAVLGLFCASTLRVFMFPARGMPAHVDAIVMLAGKGDRYSEALKLARQHRAAYLLISLGSAPPAPGTHGAQVRTRCALPVRGVTEICFAPDPATTQGEAEYVGRLAAERHWRSLALVTITPQDSRARLRFGRCFSGPVYVMTGSLHAYGWPAEIAYEWAATLKAVLLQRSC